MIDDEKNLENAEVEQEEIEGAPEAEPQDGEVEPEKKEAGKNRGNLQIALKEEREARKRAQAESKEALAKLEKINQRLAKAFSDDTTEEKLPAFEEDPAHYLKKKADETEKDTKELKEFLQQQRAVTELSSFAQSQVSAFKKEAPDYDAAYEYVRAERIADVMATDECSEAEAVQQVNQEELSFTVSCARAGRNPAKALYNYAKRRGYKAGEGGDEEKLDTIKKGMASSRSLSSSAGKSPAVLTAEALAGMSDDEFAEFKRKNPRKFREIMGATSA